jgi:acetyl esterase/lipase
VRRLAAALVTASFVIATLIAGCSDDSPSKEAVTVHPTTTAPRYEEAVFDEVGVTSDIEYGSAPGVDGAMEALKLDLYEPTGDTAKNRPLLIFVHGGGFGFGDKAVGVSSVLAPTFAKLGYVTASINYRLLAPGGCSGSGSDQSRCQAAAIAGIHDGQAAVRFLRAHADEYGIDPDRIGIGGESAGAIVSVGAGVWSEDPGESGTPGVSSAVSAWMSLSGGLPGGLFVSARDAPGLLFHGTADAIVPYQWSVETDDAMKKAGVPEELVTYDGAGHVPFEEHRDDIIAKTTAFFAQHVVGMPADSKELETP